MYGRLNELVQLCFMKKNGQHRYRNGQLLFINNTDSNKNFTETDMIKMIECLIDNILVIWQRISQQSDSSCAHHVPLFL